MHTAIEVLEHVIKAKAPDHYPDKFAPNSWDELKPWLDVLEKGNPIPVYNGGSDHTIYSSDEVNYAFRAWHDAIHLVYGLSFSKEDELAVATIHYQQVLDYCREHGIGVHLARQAANLIFADVAGQVEYFYTHREFVNDQAAFVYDYIDNGYKLNSKKY